MTCVLCEHSPTTDTALGGTAHTLALCAPCAAALEHGPQDDVARYSFLTDTIWSEESAVKIASYRLLSALRDQAWASDVRDIAYLTDEELAGAEAVTLAAPAAQGAVHRDANGVALTEGDSVVLIKDLPVKGAGFTAKRGTAVRRISLVQDNPEHIEGRVNDQRIVILTKYVKRSS